MKTTTFVLCFGILANLSFTSLQANAQTKCEYLTRFCCDFVLDLPAGFSGKQDFGVYKDKIATVTAKSCEGPFSIEITNADGTVESAKYYARGTAISDTSYIESPEPPYDLNMFVETIYMAKEIK